MTEQHIVRCSQCDYLLDEPASALPEDRQPCPDCGSLKRRYEVHIEETLTLDEGLGLKQKRPGLKRPVAEEVSKPEVFRETGELRRVERIIDRSDPDPEKFSYREKITDKKSGEVVREVDDPLKDHTGHGSAKPPKPTAE